MIKHALIIHEDYQNEEIDSQADYNLQTGLELDQFYMNHPDYVASNNSTEEFLDIVTSLNSIDDRAPPLQCSTFYRKEKNKFAFNKFLMPFNSFIGSRKKTQTLLNNLTCMGT